MNREEVVLMFFEGEEPKAILHTNGHDTFWKLKKMTREEKVQLLTSDK